MDAIRETIFSRWRRNRRTRKNSLELLISAQSIVRGEKLLTGRSREKSLQSSYTFLGIILPRGKEEWGLILKKLGMLG